MIHQAPSPLSYDNKFNSKIIKNRKEISLKENFNNVSCKE